MSVSPARVADAVERLCARDSDSRALRAGVVEELRRAIGGEYHAFVLTDPRTAVGVDPHADIPDLAELPATIRAKYLTRVNRWTSLDVAARLGERRSESLLWRQVQHPHGIADVASLVLRDAHGCWGFLDLWSAEEYNDLALEVLTSVAPALTRALRMAVARSFVVSEPLAGGPAVLILDDELTVVGHTASSEDRLRTLLPGAGKPIPAAAYNVAAQLLAVEAGVDGNEPSGRVHLGGGTWATLRASRLEPTGDVAVTIETATADERLDLFARAHGLTPRETEILRRLAQGEETAGVARALSLSPFTVQDHLKSVFDRTGARSRRGLVARVLGVTADAPR